jgi:hypothetical protein
LTSISTGTLAAVRPVPQGCGFTAALDAPLQAARGSVSASAPTAATMVASRGGSGVSGLVPRAHRTCIKAVSFQASASQGRHRVRASGQADRNYPIMPSFGALPRC